MRWLSRSTASSCVRRQLARQARAGLPAFRHGNGWQLCCCSARWPAWLHQRPLGSLAAISSAASLPPSLLLPPLAVPLAPPLPLAQVWGKGRVTLLGDAAHMATPMLAQVPRAIPRKCASRAASTQLLQPAHTSVCALMHSVLNASRCLPPVCRAHPRLSRMRWGWGGPLVRGEAKERFHI